VTTEELIGVWCLAAYLHNTSGFQFAEDLFPGRHPSYIAEYATMFAEAPSRAIGKLDDDNFRKLAAIAVERHGAAARARFMSPMERLRTFMDKPS